MPTKLGKFESRWMNKYVLDFNGGDSMLPSQFVYDVRQPDYVRDAHLA
jgi:hypothetical protein